MKKVAYICFKTPAYSEVAALLKAIENAGVAFTHFGKKDPPSRNEKTPSQMAEDILQIKESNKWVFFRDSSLALEGTLMLAFDKRWTHSDLSFSLLDTFENLEKLKAIAVGINAYVCFAGNEGLGKDQLFELLHKAADCPSEILENIRLTSRST